MRLTRLLRFSAQSQKCPPKDSRWHFSGMTWTDMKKHYSIIPMYVMSIFASFMAGAYVLRMALRHPEMSWTKQNPEPWNEYKNKQYKFLDSGRDYSRSSPIPPYK